MRYRNDTGSTVLFPGLGLEVPAGGELILPDDVTAPGGFTPFNDTTTPAKARKPKADTTAPDPGAADTTPTEG